MSKKKKVKKPKFIRCKDCEERVMDYGVGFQPRIHAICGKFDIEIYPYDGCTFGSKGKSQYVAKRADNGTYLNGHESVMGDPL